MFGFFRRDKKLQALQDKVQDMTRTVNEKNAEIQNLKSRINVLKLDNATAMCKLEGTNSLLKKQNKYASCLYAKMKAWQAVAAHIDPELVKNPKKYKDVFKAEMNKNVVKEET